jgi:hypothetical protein
VFFIFVLNPGIKELELAAGKDRMVSGDCGCPSLSYGKLDRWNSLVLRWHGQNVDSVIYV